MKGHQMLGLQEPVASSSTRATSTWNWIWWIVKWMLMLGVVAASTALLAWICFKAGVDVNELQAKVMRTKPWLIACQVLTVVAIGLFWPQIVAWGQRKGIVKDFERDQVLALRPKVQAFLWAYLLLVPIGPASIYRLFAL